MGLVRGKKENLKAFLELGFYIDESISSLVFEFGIGLKGPLFHGMDQTAPNSH